MKNTLLALMLMAGLIGCVPQALAETKYIATGWYQGNIGLPQVQTAGINDRQYMDSMAS